MNDWNVNSESNKPREFHHLTGFLTNIFMCCQLQSNCWFYQELCLFFKMSGSDGVFRSFVKTGSSACHEKCVWEYMHMSACSCLHTTRCVLHSPKRERIPQATHITSDIPTLPEFCRIPFGEMNIPAPMMVPMIKAIPRSRVTFFRSSTFSSGASALGSSFVRSGSFSPKLLWGETPLGTVFLVILFTNSNAHTFARSFTHTAHSLTLTRINERPEWKVFSRQKVKQTSDVLSWV